MQTALQKGVQLAEHPGHKNALQRMGYGPNTLVPLDFSPREFDPMNGAGGRVPLLMDEFEKIGLQNPTVENKLLFCRQGHQGASFVEVCLRLP